MKAVTKKRPERCSLDQVGCDKSREVSCTPFLGMFKLPRVASVRENFESELLDFLTRYVYICVNNYQP